MVGWGGHTPGPSSPKLPGQSSQVSQGPGCCVAIIRTVLLAMPQGNNPTGGGRGSPGSPLLPWGPPCHLPSLLLLVPPWSPMPISILGLRGHLRSNLGGFMLGGWKVPWG